MPLAGGRPRRGRAADLLVVGLGNPGDAYAGTRHNVGAEVVERLAARGGLPLRRTRERARVAEWHRDGRLVVLAVPLTYMNESGEAVGRLARRHGTPPERIVVVHDELDLPVGTLRVKAGGGLAGHNGLRSVKDHLRSDAFGRVRIGVAKPPSAARGADHVLSRFGRAERQVIEDVLERAADAVEVIAEEGIDAAMNRFNRR